MEKEKAKEMFGKLIETMAAITIKNYPNIPFMGPVLEDLADGFEPPEIFIRLMIASLGEEYCTKVINETFTATGLYELKEGILVMKNTPPKESRVTKEKAEVILRWILTKIANELVKDYPNIPKFAPKGYASLCGADTLLNTESIRIGRALIAILGNELCDKLTYEIIMATNLYEEKEGELVRKEK